MQRILVADTETTGLNCKVDEIVEVAFIEINEQLEEVNRFCALVNPQRPICPAASAAHCITDEQVAQAPLMSEVLAPFGADYFEDVFLIAHNAKFDKGFLDKHWNIQGSFCTVRASRQVYPEAPNHKLQTLRYMLKLNEGIETSDALAHSAMGDAEVLLELLRHMVVTRQMSLPDFVDLVEEPQHVESMPFGKYRGANLASLTASYVRWLLALEDLDKDLRGSLEKIHGKP